MGVHEDWNIEQNKRIQNLEYRIAQLQNEAGNMQREIHYLKERSLQTQRQAQAQPQMQAQQQMQMQPQAQMQPSMQAQPQMQMQPQPQVQPQMQMQAPPSSAKRKDGATLEKKLGMNIMAVVASLLIFIGLIFFASLIYPLLTDTLKIAFLFVFSGTLSAVGILAHWKKNHSFFLAIAGCGVGALYISLLLTNLYFHVTGDLLLYIMIAVWSILVYVLSKFQSKLFLYIGHLGVIIATILGAVSISEDVVFDVTMYGTLSIFFIVISLFYLLADRKRDIVQQLIVVIFNLVALFVLSTVFTNALYEWQPVSWIRILVVLVGIFYATGQLVIFRLTSCLGKMRILQDGFFFFFHLCVLIYAMAFAGGSFEYSMRSDARVIQLLSIGMLWLLYEWRAKKGALRSIYLPILTISLLIVVAGYDGYMMWIGHSILVIPALLYGYFRKDALYKALGYGILGIYLLTADMTYYMVHISLGIALLMFSFLLVIFIDKQYKAIWKILSYTGLFVFCMRLISVIPMRLLISQTDTTAVFFIFLTILNTSLLFTPFIKNWSQFAQKELSTEIVMRIVGGILMLFGLGVMNTDLGIGLHILVILATLYTYCGDIGMVLRMPSSRNWSGIYIGGKLTIFMVVAAYSLEASSPVISIIMFVLAVASILFGFLKNNVSFRIYGLILSLISLCKLILFDIQYDHLFARAASFLICGVLCFVISFIYYLMNKKIEEQQ